MVMILSLILVTGTIKTAKATSTNPAGDISVVAYGTTPTTFGGTTNSWTISTGGGTIPGYGSLKSYQIAVDIRLDNSLNNADGSEDQYSNVWGYSFGLSWSAPTLQLVKVVDEPYLVTGADSPSDGLVAPGTLIDNTNGVMKGGIANAMFEGPNGYANMPESDGALVTLIFNVTTTGTATVTVSNVLLLASGTDTGSAPTSINNAQISLSLPSWPLAVTSTYGSPYPAVGTDNMVKGTTVVASVVSPVVAGGVTYTCNGWTGTGSVPASGSSTSATFTINAASTIT